MPDKIVTLSDNPPQDLHLQILGLGVEKHMDFDFAHFKKTMAPAEYELYRKIVVRDFIKNFLELVKQ